MITQGADLVIKTGMHIPRKFQEGENVKLPFYFKNRLTLPFLNICSNTILNMFEDIIMIIIIIIEVHNFCKRMVSLFFGRTSSYAYKKAYRKFLWDICFFFLTTCLVLDGSVLKILVFQLKTKNRLWHYFCTFFEIK